MRVHAFIFSWGRLAPDAVRLSRLISPAVHRTTVISSGFGAGMPDWVTLDDSAYFGEQWNAALQLFSGDILLHHQADALLMGEDYPGMVASAVDSMRNHACGIYAPRVDYSYWDCSHRDAGAPYAGSLHRVFNTDCTCWALHRDVLEHQPRHIDNHLGWGMDILYCNQSRHLKRPVLRDYRWLVGHPKSTGYNTVHACEEMQRFRERYDVSDTRHSDWL